MIKPKLENDFRDALHFLRLIDGEWRSDPMSVQCFDLRVVKDVRDFVERYKDEI